MKKLLSITLLLSSLLFVWSCSKDDDDDTSDGGTTTAFDNWNDPKSENYVPQGYNPVVGKWVTNDKKNKITFTDNFGFEQLTSNSNGGWTTNFTRTYIINNKAFKLNQAISAPQGNSDLLKYSLSGEVLTIVFPEGDAVIYYRDKDEPVVTQFDDWNDKYSPNYKPEGYNPVLGEWITGDKLEKVSFNRIFDIRTYVYANGKWTRKSARGYKISDKALLLYDLIDYPLGATTLYNYTLSGDELTIKYTDRGSVKYTRLRDENGNPIVESVD